MKKLVLTSVAAMLGISLVFAQTTTATTQPIPMGGGMQVNAMQVNGNQAADDKVIWVDPDSSNVTYDVSALGLANYATTNKPAILKIRCDAKQILKDLGITNTKVVSVGIQDGDFTFTYDFNNCSMYGGKTNYAQFTNEITEAEAIKMAKDFLATHESLRYFRTMVGEPVVTYRNNYDLAGVAREGKYYSMSIVFPMTVTTKSVYQMYGEPAGLTMDVNNKGVNSVSAAILPFKMQKADSVKLTSSEFENFIKKGGNNPYYPPFVPGVDNSTLKDTVKFVGYDKIWVLTYKYSPTGGTPALYLTSGIRVKSDKKIDNGPNTDKRDYATVVSDYKIGNNSYPIAY